VIVNPDYTIGFDAYDCTVRAEPDEVLHRLALDTQSSVVCAKSKGRWSERWELHRGEGPAIGFVSYSSSRPDEPFIESKSHAPEVSAIVRRDWPQHRVARVDARIDFNDELYWYVFEPLFLEYHARAKVWHEPRGCHVDPSMGGRTWYGAKPLSARRIRLYEKGCELGLQTRGPIRLEVQDRPPSKLKAHYASLTCEEVLMAHPFVRFVATRLNLDLATAPRAPADRERSDLDRTLDWIARQYLPTMRLLRERFETVDELVVELERRIELDREVKKQCKELSTWPNSCSTVAKSPL